VDLKLTRHRYSTAMIAVTCWVQS